MSPPSETAPTYPAAATQLAIVSGLSGSGKTIALRTLEDLEHYCVDNLPVELIPAFVESLTRETPSRFPLLAVGVDVRNRAEHLSRLPEILARLAESGISCRLLFLDTRDEILFKRFSDTRRRHPLTGDGVPLVDAIAQERRLLRPLVAIADQVIDTSDMNVHQLRRRIATEFSAATPGLSLLIESFAYKRGVPADADFVFDARCLPNPHWEPTLRPLSGRDAPVCQFFERLPEVAEYQGAINAFISRWLPRFEAEQRNYVTVCIGCTGGRHRSVYLVERIAAIQRQSRSSVIVFHRELE
jgi:UPF0042 nucleotide-binding protein